MATSTKNLWMYGLLGVGVVAVGAGAFVMRSRAGEASTLPTELRVASLKAQAEADPGTLRDTMREAMRRDDLTDEQRSELSNNMRSVWQSMMTERIDAWFAAQSEADKNAVLDAQIDEFETRRAEWEKQRAEREKKGDKDEAGDRERFRQMFSPPSKEERKAQSESRSADQTARMMTYFSAMRARMEQRGIKPPGGPGGGRGPWGRR